MISKKRSALIALLAAAALTLGACASGDAPDPGGSEGGGSASAGEPVSGGTLRAIELSPIVGLDPVQAFSSTSTPMSYSAIYGQFLVPNTETAQYECGLCESFSSEDGGLTYEIVTREGMTFSDGTPFDAAALQYNWERIQDPANGSASLGFANQIASMEIVDERTLKLTMTSANPGFIGNFSTYALQWIASPAALEAGTEAFNKNPVGAGPFLFESWVPNGTLKVTRNPDYYDAPRPYLDAIEIQGVSDSNQRLNALLAGSADLILATDAFLFPEAEAAGFVEHLYTFNGGVGIMFNTSKPPFDDPRARQAIAYALDRDAISDAATGGYPSAPRTLFTEDSPLFSDIPLATHDPERAQELFDELAAEGKPLEFGFAMTPGPSVQGVFDAMQPQLAQYDNVTITADQRDASEAGVLATKGDYEMTFSSLAFADPVGRLWGALHSEAGPSNYTRFNDPATDAALDAAGATTDVDEQREQFAIVQERLAELVPYILVQQFLNGAISTDKVQGVEMFGFTTPHVAGIWLQP
ncbi:ABC transporter substrate-binding protein [Microbacterium sp. No. 7]|uniref:ABC transporter substrate-binding protein n=1 Tax=Microbacterium sp. No. 7 TaxID=1714373 RepID=UPI0006D2A849|nr:ABC transporter substrate-binding protein [Microbacterium sp. No. 7]ALJ21943.1 hypothetical protein AOA12_19410 [Microbacterium sp. No. 7]